MTTAGAESMFDITDTQLDQYRDDGFVVLRNAVPAEFVTPLLDAVGRDALVVVDADGNRQHLNSWTWCGDDLIGRIPRCEPLVALAARVIGGPVHHWHSKLSWKSPGSPGSWDWHQDYAFWREEGVARPAMTTVGIALDDHDSTNGCLRIIAGSHRHGVLAHPSVGHGRAADPSVVDQLRESSPAIDVELAAGDAIVFDCRLLHGSGPNRTDRPRTFIHCAYNAIDNPASTRFIDGHQVHELRAVPATAIAPGMYDRVWGDTAFIQPERSGYGGHSGYQVLAAEG